jgi:hypothetical protein
MGGPLGDASKRNIVFIGDAVHFLPGVKECRLFGEYHGILQFGGFRDLIWFLILLKIEIGVFQFQAIGKG